MNKICNHFNHILYVKEDKSGRTDQNSVIGDYDKKSIIVRVVEISIPFIGLYQPAARPLELILASVRLISSGTSCSTSGIKKIVDVSISVFLLYAVYSQTPLSQVVTSSYEIIITLSAIVKSLREKDYEKALYELGQLTVNISNLAFMMSGALELLLLIEVLKAFLLILHSKHEWKCGRFPEVAANIAMALIHCKRAQDIHKAIQVRDALLVIERCRQLFESATRGKAVAHIYNHALMELDTSIEQHRSQLY